MQSVRYLIKMRDEKRAQRDESERQEREKLGLPPKEEELKEGETSEDKVSVKAIEAAEEPEVPHTAEQKDGILADMLSASGEEDSTSEDSSSESEKEGEEEAATSKIEWSQVEAGRRLVQEIRAEQPAPAPQADCWTGYRGNVAPGSSAHSSNFASEFEAINSLLFHQNPHVEKKSASKTLEELRAKKEQMIITEIDNEAEKTESVEKKPLIEIIGEYEKKIKDSKEANAKSSRGVAVEQTCKGAVIEHTGIVEEGNKIIDHDKKLLKEKAEITEEKKTLKKVTIKELPTLDSNKDNIKNEVQESDTAKEKDVKDDTGKKVEDKTEDKVEKKTEGTNPTTQGTGEGVSLISYMHHMNHPGGAEDDDEDLKPSAEDLEIFAELDREMEERDARIARGEPAVDPMKNYDKKTMDEFYAAEECTPAHEVTEKTHYTTYKTDNAFDRVALSQLTGGEKPDERKARLTHVPGAILFRYVDKDAPKEVEATATAAAPVGYEIGEEHIESESSSGETESINISSDSDSSDGIQVKLPPAKTTRLQNTLTELKDGDTNSQRLVNEVKTKADVEEKVKGKDDKPKGKGDENNSKGNEAKEKEEVEKGKIDNKKGNDVKNTDKGEVAKGKQKYENKNTRKEDNQNERGDGNRGQNPGKVNKRMVRNTTSAKAKDIGKRQSVGKGDTKMSGVGGRSRNAYGGETVRGNRASCSTDNLVFVDADEAKQSIIDTINSYEDDRFPSQGVSADPAEEAAVSAAVARELLLRTRAHAERAALRAGEAASRRAGHIDNKTNAIIEKIADELDNDYSLPEVSRILEVHMSIAEQRWRAGEPVSIINQESAYEEDLTLTPDQEDPLLEETLTENNAELVDIENNGEANQDGKNTEKVFRDTDQREMDDNAKPINKDKNIGNKDESVVINDEAGAANNDLELLNVNANDMEKAIRVANVIPAQFINQERAEIADFSAAADDSGIALHDDGNDSQLCEALVENINDSGGDDIFEDCVDDIDESGGREKGVKDEKSDFDRVKVNYSLEMKLALGIGDND